MLKQMFDQVREKSPLIHNITNYVTVNDCANMVLACGASPIMADDKEEVAEIQTICAGLNINIGTLNSRTIESMKIAGMRANELGHPDRWTMDLIFAEKDLRRNRHDDDRTPFRGNKGDLGRL